MKSMVLLIDANIILNYLMNRNPGFEEARKIMDFCRRDDIHGYVAFHTVSIIWYVLRRKPQEERRRLLLDICELLTVTGALHKDVIDAILDDDFSDFEDCLQVKCAENIFADYIVTENINDYSKSSIPAVTAVELIKVLEI
ncbi:MAG: PIN domain-containing protein [Selenomonadaceae bacterium]|nr:PIN domain-containing protein [Selenomonadaceae bacterium]